MCGIAGFCNPSCDWEIEIKKMNDAMIHRGPDAEGIWHDERVVLGHRRLSILDLSDSGKQPFISHNERYVLVFNGEIYNHKSICKKMEQEGYSVLYRSTSDTEVLIEAIAIYGLEKAISICKGMFAFALYDRKEKCLYLVRDRMGEKPLYYGFVNGRFVFASDLSSIKTLRDFQNKMDVRVLDLYFTYGCIPAPYSIYEDINKVEPGQIIKIDYPYNKNNVAKSFYWTLEEVAVKGEKNPFSGSIQEAADCLEELTIKALKEQMIADVPIGAFLSGGVDSSVIVSLLQKCSGSKAINTYTIGIKDSDFDEADVARETARLLGTNHTEMYIGENDIKETILDISNIFSEPMADSSQIPTYLVSKLTRQHVTVALSGDGGDELFCGYNYYIDANNKWKKISNIPEFLRKLDYHLLKPFYKGTNCDNNFQNKLFLLSSIFEEDLYEKERSLESGGYQLLNQDFIKSLKDGFYQSKYSTIERGLIDGNLNKLMLMSQKFILPDDILTKVDRCAMAVSLETRIPFFDKDIIEYAWTLPESFKYDGIEKKKILRCILNRYLPYNHISTKKRGFSIPIQEWLRKESMVDWAEGILFGVSDYDNIINRKEVERIWKNYKESGEWSAQIWYLILFYTWRNKNFYQL